jgi:hypothetical protein
MALSPAEMDAAVLANLEARTGKGLDHWTALLDGAPAFAKPAAAVAWLKAEHGLGHVTAQIIVRKWRARDLPDPGGDPVDTALEGAGSAVFRRIATALAADVPNQRIMPRKSYVGLGTPVQFAVAARPKTPGAVLWLALVAQDGSLPPLPPAPRLGGSDRFKLLFEIRSEADERTALAHLRAAAMT